MSHERRIDAWEEWGEKYNVDQEVKSDLDKIAHCMLLVPEIWDYYLNTHGLRSRIEHWVQWWLQFMVC